jgi:hypothetical protein
MRSGVPIVFGLGCLGFLSDARADNTITVGSRSAAVGESGVVVTISIANDDEIGGYQFDLLYPPSELEVVSAEAGINYELGSFSTNLAYSSESIRVLDFAFGTPPFSAGSGDLATVEFNVLSTATQGCYSLGLDGVVLSDPVGVQLPVTTVDGWFYIGINQDDLDGDGYDSCSDCDDADPLVNPGAVEVCDGLDNDCNSLVDEGLTAVYHPDADGDGFGDSASPSEECGQPAGYVSDGSDCDDANAAANPGATEVCDGFDNDCDGATDEGVTVFYFPDSDGDGFGDSDYSTEECEQPDGYVEDHTDCDDGDATISPDGTETCDGQDNDCDGDEDDLDADVEFGESDVWFADSDGDGFGDAASSSSSCAQPEGTSSDSTDCDDSEASVYPEAEELCDDLDNDCDMEIDEDASTYYADSDGDGYGDPDAPAALCEAEDGYVADSSDCDDSDASSYPGAEEVEDDSIDQDCDGEDTVGDVPDDPSEPSDDGAEDDLEEEDATDKGSCAYVAAPELGIWSLGLLLGLAGLRSRRFTAEERR